RTGMLSPASPHPAELNPLLVPRLQEVLPLFSVAVKPSVAELHSRVESFIKEQFPAIHPVVEWRFRKTVLGAMERPGSHDHGQGGELDPIVFRDVHPLFAVSDIR